ncbi:ThuA domain-containing protein [Verrucomicrobiales bacterium BCK34]|nr:ThuA domain-containing protein [Verrucomicrobiales bacterium BCK34]
MPLKVILNFVVLLPFIFVGFSATSGLAEEKAKIVFVAGKPSHPARTHEHKAGCHLLADLLNGHYGERVTAKVYENGWPEAAEAFADADAVIIFSDGGQRHPAFFHLKTLADLRSRGIGLGAIHYAVEMEPGETNDALIASIGGAFEVDYSVNPHWVADFKVDSDHPVANGVEPFAIEDEWYFNMRFTSDGGVTPILLAVPPAETMSRPDGHHSGNPEVRKMVEAKEPQHVCWVYESPGTDGAKGHRGFGFTGGHFHDNWANDGYRKTVLNAICWIAGVEIPEAGMETPTPDKAALDRNLDDKPAPKARKKKAAKK